jgi:hypothetical protein
VISRQSLSIAIAPGFPRQPPSCRPVPADCRLIGASARAAPALLARRVLYYVCNHFRREMKPASNESPLSMTPINNGLRSCWYSSSAYFTAGLAGNLSRPCEGSIGCGPEKRGEPAAPAKPLSEPGRRQRAKELAAAAIEGIIDQDTPPEERAQRKHRLTEGPSEFREDRVDLLKAKK